MRCPCSEMGSQSTDTHTHFRTPNDRLRVRIHGTNVAPKMNPYRLLFFLAMGRPIDPDTDSDPDADKW
jgi:hypothetical protein